MKLPMKVLMQCYPMGNLAVHGSGLGTNMVRPPKGPSLLIVVSGGKTQPRADIAIDPDLLEVFEHTATCQLASPHAHTRQ